MGKNPTITEKDNVELKVTVKDLEKEFDLDGKKIRSIIRSLGIRAPLTGNPSGMGPQAKYEWDPNAKQLKAIKKAINNYLEMVNAEDTEEAAG